MCRFFPTPGDNQQPAGPRRQVHAAAARPAQAAHRWGYSLVDLIVALVVVALLIGLVVILATRSRETARQQACVRKAIALALACAKHEAATGSLPMGVNDPGDVIRNEPEGLHQGWLIALLPHLGQSAVYDKVERQVSVYAEENAAARALTLSEFLCPVGARIASDWGQSDYAGVHHHLESPIAADNQGLLFVRSAMSLDAIPDGEAHTLLVGEKLTAPGELGWMSGTRATLRNAGWTLVQTAQTFLQADRQTDSDDPLLWVGGFGSHHTAGVNFVFADGRDHVMTFDVDMRLFQQLADRDDGS